MSHPAVNVTEVEVLTGRQVRLHFDDAVTVERDLTPLLWGPIFDRIRSDAAAFGAVAVDHDLGVICWPNGADIDGELLRYDDLWDATVRLSRSA